MFTPPIKKSKPPSSGHSNVSRQFEPPVKKSLIDDSIGASSLEKQKATVKYHPPSSKNSLEDIRPNQKRKKRNKIACYMQLENFLVDPSKNSKLQLWRKGSGHEQLTVKLAGLSDNSESSSSQITKETLEPSTISDVETVPTINSELNCSDQLDPLDDVISIVPSVRAKTKQSVIAVSSNETMGSSMNNKKYTAQSEHAGHAIAIVPFIRGRIKQTKTIHKKSRMHCGKKGCIPCSRSVDCGECLQCLTNKTKK